MTFDDVMRFISVFTSGVTEGILVAVLLAVMPAMLGLPDAMALRFKQRFDPLVDRINPPFVALAAISAVLVLVVADLSSTATIFAAVGIAGGLGVAVTSLGFNMRINREMASWPADAPPATFRPQIARWSAGHRVRTLCGTLAFAGYLVAALT